MADDMLIGVGVKADFSSLKAESRSAAETLRTAEQNMKEALQQFGSAAEQGSAQAIAALKGYEAELASARAAAAIATPAFAAAGNAAAHTVPQFAAASGTLRELQGNFSHNIRAAERFLSTTLGLGPALQAAFPVVGALAFAGVIYEMGKSLYDAFDMGGEKARALAKEIDGDASSMRTMNDELKLQADKLDAADAKIEHKPFNGVKLAIDEASVAADKLDAKLSGVLGKISGTVKDMSGSFGQRLLGEKGSTGYEQTMIDEHSRRLSEAVTEQDQLNESVSYGLSLQTRLAEMRDHLAKRDLSPATEASFRESEIPAVEHMIAMQKQEQEAIQKTSEVEKKAASNTAAEQRQEAAKRAAKEAEDRAREQIRIWQEMGTESQRATDEIQAHGVAQLKEEEEAQKRAAEVEKGHMEDSKRTFEERVRAEEKDAEAAAENAIAQTEAAAKIAEARIAYLLATGAISQQQAAHALAAIKAAEYTDQIKALNDELLALAAIQNEGGDTGDKQRQVGTKITSLTGDRDAALIQGSAKTAGEYTKLWEHALTAVGRQFQNVEDQMLRGQVSFSTGMKRMTAEVALDAVHWTQRWLQQHFMANAMKLASSVTTNAGTVASDASAAAASTAITRSTALHQAFIHAKLAAVKGFDWGTGWGGPIVGAIAAAAAFTGAMAWAMFEQGGVAQQTGPAYLHAGERVLTARQTATFDRVMGSGGSSSSSSSSTTLHYSPTINGAGNTKEIQKIVRQSSREVAKATQRAIRNGHFARGN